MGRDPATDTVTAPDPRDVLQDAWLRHRDANTGLVPIVPVDPMHSSYLAARTWDNTAISDAVDALEADGAVARVQAQARSDDVRGHIRFLGDAAGAGRPTRDFAHLAAVAHSQRTSADRTSARPVFLASLFDGTGTARYAVGGMINRLGQAAEFRGSTLVEIAPGLARGVSSY